MRLSGSNNSSFSLSRLALAALFFVPAVSGFYHPLFVGAPPSLSCFSLAATTTATKTTAAATEKIQDATATTKSKACTDKEKGKGGENWGKETHVQLMEAYGSQEDQELVQNALQFAAENGSVNSNTSEHALGVAQILSDLNLDVPSVVAGILQCSTIDMDLYNLEQVFGAEIASLVRGVTEINDNLSSYQQRQQYQEQGETENYRKLILALAQDIRVVLIKLADQTQRMRMLQQSSEEEQKSLAKETLDLYAPLAHRLGMYALKTELEDTSLQFWKPKSFCELKDMVAAREVQRQQYTQKVMGLLQEYMIEGGLTIRNDTDARTVTGRAKSFYSIYQKMQQQNLAFDDIQDLMAFRILVDDLTQCYQALGIVHSHWKPVKGRFKDYIALPKPNGYQSLHTTVIGPEGKRMEVQIRTHDMHRVAEGGVAAHWMYKDNQGSASSNVKGSSDAERYKMLRQLVQWAQQQDDESSSTDDQGVLDLGPEHISEREVFVFSPQGQLFSLAKGATVLDFAYLVHSQVGHHCVGAKVNGKMVPLKHTVESGDTIEILQSSNQKPKQEWLKVVQTTKAKARIKSWLKKEKVGDESIALGRAMLEKGLHQYKTKYPNLDGMAEYKKRLPHILSAFKLNNEQHLSTALAYGQISVTSVLQEVFVAPPQSSRDTQEADEAVWGTMSDISTARPKTPDGVVVGGKRNILISFCRNCNPLYGEEVQGVVTQGRGVKVHRLDCQYLLQSDPARHVEAVWDEAAKTTKRPLVVEVLCEDTPGMLAGMSKAITVAEVNIRGVVLKKLSNGHGLARFELMLSSIADLQRVQLQLLREPGVINVKRK